MAPTAAAQAALVDALVRDRVPDPRPPDRFVHDLRHPLPPGTSALDAIARCRRDVSWVWKGGPNLGIYRGRDTVKLAEYGWQGTPLDALHLIEPLHFEWMGCASMNFTWGGAGLPVEYAKGAGFADGHYGHGWICAFQGDGHRQLVSRRWLDYGPWRVLRGANDTTLIQFHDAEIDDLVGLEQAKPGHERMGISPTGGFIPTTKQLTEIEHKDLIRIYDPNTRTLVVTLLGRQVSQAEMLEACAIRLYQPMVKPVDNVAFVFMDEREARAHLHELWLRELECRTFVDGKEVRLDLDYVPPPPVVPDWVKALQDRDGY